MRGHGEHLIDHLYDRVMRAFGVLFVGVLVIVLSSRLLAAYLARRAQTRARGAVGSEK
jgi:hypothetical protein